MKEFSDRTFYIRTFGCQMNKNDSSIICHVLSSAGMREVDTTERADIVIINTCSVRGHAEQRALGHIATLRPWRERQGKVLAVVGCMAQRCTSLLMTEYPFVDLILGPDSYRNIVCHITTVMESPTRIQETRFCRELYGGVFPRSSGICDFVSIMRGCSNYCSYCVVPFVRGSARSRPAADILAHVSHLVKSGVMDVTLLGQNVNEYAHGTTDFAGLLEQVSRIPGICRVRFLTSHPKDLDEKTVDLVAHEPVLCEWFHIPLQSGSNRILELMNRHYTIEQYRDLVARIRETVPGASITTDVIVGFPTESEQEYQDTINSVHEMQFDDAYMYRYSARSGTAAAKYDTLPEQVIHKRLKNLIVVQNEIVLKKTRAMIGHTYEILFEGPARQGGMRGKTRGNKDVIVMSGAIPGAVSRVRIHDIKGRTPIGSLVT